MADTEEEEISIEVDLKSTVPVYRQVADGLRKYLVSGAFGPGEQLPTVRELAADVGVNHNTVAEAYRVLAGEGWLQLGRRRGAKVIPWEKRDADEEVTVRCLRRIEEVWAEARALGVDADRLQGTLKKLLKRSI